MIIDLILNRKEGDAYNPKTFYNDVERYACYWSEMCRPILEALDEGEESDVKRALVNYITEFEYNPEIIPYINSVNWL